MKFIKVISLILVSFILVGCGKTDIEIRKEALEKGNQILKYLRAGDAGDMESLARMDNRQFVGFEGGAAPPGMNANLILKDDTLLIVDIKPYKDVRPQAVYWGAFVMGKLQYVDQKRRIIYIQARPKDWIVGPTF